MLNNRLPLYITNETCELITEENYRRLARRYEDIGKYQYVFPPEFVQGKVYPKEIEVQNHGIYTIDHVASFGNMVFAEFNTESTQIPYCLGFVSYHYTPVSWKIYSTSKTSLVWFKDYDNNIIQPPRFMIVGWLYF